MEELKLTKLDTDQNESLV